MHVTEKGGVDGLRQGVRRGNVLDLPADVDKKLEEHLVHLIHNLTIDVLAGEAKQNAVALVRRQLIQFAEDLEHRYQHLVVSDRFFRLIY